MPDLPGTLAEILALFPDQATGDISPADLRRLVVSVMERKVRLAAEGLIAETFDRRTAQGNSQMADGAVYYLGLPLMAGQVVTSIAIVVGTAGTGLTLSKVGLYDSAMNRVALSAEQGSSWQSTGVKVVALTSPYTVVASGLFYAAVIAKGTTVPSLLRSLLTTDLAGTALPGALSPHGAQTGQTDLPNPGAMGAANLRAYWMGLL